MKVSFTAQARADRNAIFDFLASRSPSGARNVIASIDQTLRLIGEHPESGSRTRRPGTRVVTLSDYPYRIFYRVRADNILVQHIRHTSRRPWTR